MSVVSTWKPKTPIGRKVKRGELNLEQILSQKLQNQEPEIIDHLIPNGLHVEILKTSSIGDGQYRRKAWVAIADRNGLLGLGSRCARTTTEAIRGATKNAKLSVFRIREYTPNRSLTRTVIGEAGNITIEIQPFIFSINARPLPKLILELAGFHAALVLSNKKVDSGMFVEAMFNALRKLSP